MKKIMMVLALCLISVVTFSQTKHEFKTYNVGGAYGTGKDIFVFNIGDTNCIVFFKLHSETNVVLDGYDEIEKFHNDLKKIYEKSKDWYIKAIENDIDTIERKLPIQLGEYRILTDLDFYNVEPSVNFSYKKNCEYSNDMTRFLYVSIKFGSIDFTIISTSRISFLHEEDKELSEFKNLVDFFERDNIDRIMNELHEQKNTKEKQEKVKNDLFN